MNERVLLYLRRLCYLCVTVTLLILAQLSFSSAPIVGEPAELVLVADDPIATPMPEEPKQWSTGAVTTVKVAPRERPSKGHPKLASSLNQLLAVHRSEGLAEAQTFATSHNMVLQDDRVQVKIVATDEAIDDIRKAVEAVGGEYQAHYQNLLQALLPIGELEALAERPDVQIIREPLRAIPLAPMQVGNQTTEGVAASNASAWHAAGYDGTGARVAIIDAGFTGYSGLLGTDLPASVTTYDWTGLGMGGSPHGTACAEIVYDMAYGATMDLHRVNTDVELGNAVAQAITDGVDIISMSLGWTIDGPGDGTGNLASIVNNARSNGIFYAVAAGNEAEVSWSGAYVNSGTSAFHAWDGASLWYNFIVITPGTGFCYIPPAGVLISAGLHWDDWTAVNQDYDLHLGRYPGGTTIYIVASSTSPQNGGGGQTPEEFVYYTASGTDCYALIVERVNASRDVCLSLDVPQMPHLEEWVTQRSLSFPADSPGAITVAAVDVSTYSLESYSSQGPTFGSGGTCSGGSTKPDIAAYANVSTVSYGAGVFNGTSAATPHVAGAAALVKEAHPGYTVTQLQSFLEGRAIDLGDPGKDNLYGSGQLDLGDANSPPNTPSSPSPADGATVQDVNVDLGWTGGDPDTGDTVTYDVYLEADDSTPDDLTCDDVSTLACDPGTLAYGTHYYWYVVATDDHDASTIGDTWDFTTAGHVIYLPIIMRNRP